MTDAERLIDRAARDVEDRGLPGCAIVVLRDDEVVLDEVIGAPRDATWSVWSISKALFAGLLATVLSDGSLRPDQHVAEVLPWFTGGGKDDVRVDHLLNHTAGLANAPMRTVVGGEPAARREQMRSWHVHHQPGDRFAYHATSAHWVLATLVEELLDESYADAWAQRVAVPLGLNPSAFRPDPDDLRWQPVEAVGEPTGEAVVATLRQHGVDLDRAVGEAGVDTLLTYLDPAVRTVGSPGGGAITSAMDVARFYSAVLRRDAALGDPTVLDDLTSNVVVRLVDPSLGVPVNRTRAFSVAGEDGHAAMRQLPDSLGPRVFGHPGVCGQLSWADPDTGLVFVHVTNGLHRDPLWWWQRCAELNALAATLA